MSAHTPDHDAWDAGGYCNELVLDAEGYGYACGYRARKETIKAIDPSIIEKAAKALFDEDSAWVVASYDDKQYHREAAERALLAVADDLRAEAWVEGFADGSSHGIAYQAGDYTALPLPSGLNPYRTPKETP